MPVAIISSAVVARRKEIVENGVVPRVVVLKCDLLRATRRMIDVGYIPWTERQYDSRREGSIQNERESAHLRLME